MPKSTFPVQRDIYQQQLVEREGGEIQEARRHLQVVEQNREHFQQVWEREDRIARQERQQQQREQQRSRERDRDRGGWSR